MWLRCKRTCLILIGLSLLFGICGYFRNATAEGYSSWLANDPPHLQKIADLPNNQLPDGHNSDCSPLTYLPQPGKDTITVCVFDSPLGTVSVEGQIQTGANTFDPLESVTQSSHFLPTPDASIALVSMTAPQIGNYIGVYHNLTRASLKQYYSGLNVHYQVTDMPDEMLRNPVSQVPLQVATETVAYSTNGEWMVVNVPHQGLLRVKLSDLSTMLFSAPLEPDWYLGLGSPALAISNDGRYVAANVDLFSTGNLRMYDLSTCADQLDILPRDAQYCRSKSLWSELNSQLPGLAYLTHIRFANNETITFSAEYDLQDGHYKAAVFSAAATGAPEHMLGLLGMGDSYISGEGLFAYRDGTNVTLNRCHLSELSYPYLLGAMTFSSYSSVACSGAKTSDVRGDDPRYQGQAKDHVAEVERDKGPILANFLPGYIYQQEFAPAYLPEAIILSIGGNDVHFADIVKTCVANEGGGTCYDTYEERAELLDQINSTYPKLVTTYKTLRQQSAGARLYVVGYQQVAKTGGDCGLNVHLNGAELQFAEQLITYLNGVIKQAAATAGAFYVDTEQAFDGHRLCESGDKAVHGLTAGDDSGVTIKGHTVNLIGAESYHPTELGHRLLAGVIARKTMDLSAPMPTPGKYVVPKLDPSTPLLLGVPKTNRQIKTISYDDNMADEFMLQGSLQQVAVNGTETQLHPGTGYQVVLHSTPVLLDEGRIDDAGNIATAARIPANTQPGYHTLHVYGTNLAGEAVDIQRVVYVAASLDDLDGDGVPNTANQCLIVSPSGQDRDADGLDDACDDDITPTAGNVAVDATTNTAAAPVAGAGDTTAPIGALPTGTAPVDPATGTVLGSVTVGDPKVLIGTAAKTSPANNQEPFRVSWLIVLEVGGGWIVAGSILHYYFRRQ